MRWQTTVARLSLTLSLTSLAACSSAPENAILQQFFRASRLNDTTSLASFATARFQPNTDGTITSFDIVEISPERRVPLRSAAATEYDTVMAEEAEFVKKKDSYYLANQEAINRVLKAESVKASLGGKDVDIQTEWSRLREEGSQLQRKLSEAQRKVKAEASVVQLSLENAAQPVSAAGREGDRVIKDVTITANVRRPDDTSGERTLIVTMEKVVLSGEPAADGKWIVTGIRDANASPATKTS
jgi:hypothetical protein